MPREQEAKAQFANRVEDYAITRYKRRLDKRYPIRERDLAHPSRGSLVGCLWMKFALMLAITLILIMHSMGLDGSQPLADPFSTRMILTDLCVGWSAYALVSVFSYCYPRTKNPAVGIMLFVLMCVIIIASFFIWNAMAQAGGLLVIPIVLIVLGLIPFVMDIWGLITYRQKIAAGKMF